MNRKLFFFNVVVLFVLFLAVWGCEGDVSTVSEDPYGPVEDAAVSFGVKWPDAPAIESAARSMTASATNIHNECDAHGVDKVRVEVKSSSGAFLKSATFDCSLGQGTLTGIEPQSGCAIVVSGLNHSGAAIYQGQKTGVILHAGMNNIGTIQLEPLYIAQITVTANAGTGGSVTPTSRTINSGSTASFILTADSGFILNSSIDGTCPSGSWDGNTYTTASINGACDLIFSFRQITVPQYTVTASVGDGGSVTPANRTINSGSTASFTLTADSGFTLNSSIDGTCPSGSWDGNKYTTGSVTDNCSVSFSFIQSQQKSTVTAIAGTGGSVTPTIWYINNGSTASFTVSPDSGYTQDTSVDGTCPNGFWSDNTYTTGSVTGNCNVIFSFTIEADTRDKELEICDLWTVSQSGGYGTTIDNWDISEIPSGATFDIRFDAYCLPDKFIIEYPSGLQRFDSGWRGCDDYEGDPLYPGGIFGPGIGQNDNVFVRNDANSFRVIVIGPEVGTKWDYSIRCREMY